MASAMTDALNDQQREAILARIPLGAMGSGDDIGAAAVFLAVCGVRALILTVTLGSIWYLIPTYYSFFVLPKSQRNDLKLLQSKLPSWAPGASHAPSRMGSRAAVVVQTRSALRAASYISKRAAREPEALRHRAEQPRRLGDHKGPDLSQIRRLALAEEELAALQFLELHVGRDLLELEHQRHQRSRPAVPALFGRCAAVSERCRG